MRVSLLSALVLLSCLTQLGLCCLSLRQECPSSAVYSTASAVLQPHGSSYTNVLGSVALKQTERGLNISGRVSGLQPNTRHGFHIHESGNLTGGCAGARGHYNPNKRKHGAPGDSERHIGDFGNIEANSEGVASFQFVDKVAALNGEQSVIGRSFVVHAGVDDLGLGGNEGSIMHGNAGDRMVCGVIGVA